VAAVLRVELAPNLHLRMAERTVKARRLRRAIHKLVQVQAADVNALGVCFVAFCIAIAFGTNNLSMISLDTHIYTALQMALQAIPHWTGDGLVSVRALQLVTVGRRAEIAAILRVPMAARIV